MDRLQSFVVRAWTEVQILPTIWLPADLPRWGGAGGGGDVYVSSVSETGPDTPVYPVYLKQGRIHSVFGVSGDPKLCISHLG